MNKLKITGKEYGLLADCISRDRFYPALAGVHFTKQNKSSIRIESCDGKTMYFIIKKDINSKIIEKLAGKTIKIPKMAKTDTMIFDEYLEIITKDGERIFREYTYIEARFPNFDKIFPKAQNRKKDFKIRINPSLLPKNVPVVLSINTKEENDIIVIESYGETDNTIKGQGAIMPMKRD